MTTFQSKWGFHPCDYATYLKLKRLHKTYFEAKRKIAEWDRWYRKQPQNRVLWKRISGGYQMLGPKPEPVVPKVYREIVKKSNIIVEYQRARHGVPQESMVRPLGISASQIDAWIEALDQPNEAVAA